MIGTPMDGLGPTLTMGSHDQLHTQPTESTKSTFGKEQTDAFLASN